MCMHIYIFLFIYLVFIQYISQVMQNLIQAMWTSSFIHQMELINWDMLSV